MQSKCYKHVSIHVHGLTLLFNARSLAFIGRHLATTFTFSDVIAVAAHLQLYPISIAVITYLLLYF